MRHYSIYTLDENSCPLEIKIDDGTSGKLQLQYMRNLEKCNPGKVYWVRENHTGLVVWEDTPGLR